MSPADRTNTSIGAHKYPTSIDRTQRSAHIAQDSWINKLDLDLAYINHLLQEFRKTQRFFPFVVIPAEWTVQSMVEERPFLLLAAITTVARETPPLQEVLADEIKAILAQRIVVNGENNLDLLQGLLVHLAWSVFCCVLQFIHVDTRYRYHHHMMPRSQQAYRLLQITISMLVDRGMHRSDGARGDAETAGGGTAVFQINRVEARQLANEAKRASVGCFYLSSM